MKAAAQASSLLGVVCRSLELVDKNHMVALSVMPASFDADAASAILGKSVDEARGVLAALKRRMLISWDGRTPQYKLHASVRQHFHDVLGHPNDTVTERRMAIQLRFIKLVAQRLAQLAKTYGTRDFQLAIELMRQYRPDVDAGMQLACQEPDLTLALAQEAPDFGWKYVDGLQYAAAYRQMLQRAYEAAAARGHPAAGAEQLLIMAEHANCLRAQGKEQEAELLYRQAHEGLAQTFGPQHPHTLGAANSLAGCLTALRRYGEAEALYHQALEGREALHGQALAGGGQVPGPQLLDTLWSKSNLASCFKAQRNNSHKLADAAALYREAKEGFTRALGEQHPFTLQCVNSLAGCLKTQGAYADAEALYRQAVQGFTDTLGPQHPETLLGKNNLAGCLKHQHKDGEAEVLYLQALEGFTQALGPKHKHTLMAVNDLAAYLDAQGESQAAEPLHLRAMEGRREVLGPQHEDTLWSVFRLAGCLTAQHRHGEALPLYREAMEGRKKELGLKNKDTLWAINGLAGCLKALGDVASAAELYREALDGFAQEFGPYHKFTCSTRGFLNGCSRLQSRGRRY